MIFDSSPISRSCILQVIGVSGSLYNVFSDPGKIITDFGCFITLILEDTPGTDPGTHAYKASVFPIKLRVQKCTMQVTILLPKHYECFALPIELMVQNESSTSIIELNSAIDNYSQPAAVHDGFDPSTLHRQCSMIAISPKDQCGSR
jgi:hypothetical protein